MSPVCLHIKGEFVVKAPLIWVFSYFHSVQPSLWLYLYLLLLFVLFLFSTLFLSPFSVWLFKYVLVFHGNVSIGILAILLCLVLLSSFIHCCAFLYCFIFFQWICIIYTMQKSKVQVNKKKDFRGGKIMFLASSKLDSLHVPFTNCLEEARAWAISAKAVGWQMGDVMEPGLGMLGGVWLSKIRHGMSRPRKLILYQMSRKDRETCHFLPNISRLTKNPVKCFQVVFWLKKKIHSSNRFNNCSPFEVTKNKY